MRAGRTVRRAVACLGLLLAFSPPAVAVQAPAQRVSLAAFADSIAATTDSGSLRARRLAIRETLRRASDDALDRLRLGMVEMRLARLGIDPDSREAIRNLEVASKRQPGWPWAWHWLGLAEAQRSAWEQEDRLALGSRVGMGTLERAARRQREALRADPAFAPAAETLAALTLELRDTSLLTAATDALRRAGAVPRAAPEVLLALGRVERAAASGAAAAAAFERYLAAGGSRALGLLELARTRLAAGDSTAEGGYYEGAALADPVAVRGYRADIAAVAADSELTAFDRLEGTARAEFLRRFWTDRDRREMRAHGERLREHYRRLLFARRNFALTVTRRYYGAADAYRSGGMEIDDRGIIYVRHGEPSDRLRPFVFGLMPNESWRFDRAEGDLLFHFSSGYDQNGGGDLYDYRLVESVLDLRGAADAREDDLLLSRQSLSSVYGRMLHWGRYGAARSRARERGIGQASIAIGTSSDSHELRFARPLGAVADVVAVGAVGSGTIGHLVFAIAEPGTTPERDEYGVRYTARVRAVASDEANRPFSDVDTTIVFRPASALGRSQYLIGRVELALPHGRWRWRAAIQLGDSTGAVLPRDTVTASGGGSKPWISDLALGIRGASAAWEATPGDTVLLTPFDLFLENAGMELYYEVGGIRPGASYRHEIAVFRIKGERGVAERRPVVTLAFDEPATEAIVRAHRTLQLARLKPGRYLIEVRVVSPAGGAVARRREFQIREMP